MRAIAYIVLGVLAGALTIGVYNRMDQQHERWRSYVESVRFEMYMRHCVEAHGEQSRGICKYNWIYVDTQIEP